MADGESEIRPEAFEGWLAPRQAVERLCAVMSPGAAVQVLVARLRDGLLRGAARSVVIVRSSGPERADFAPLGPGAWNAAALADPDGGFWSTAAFETTTRANFAGAPERQVRVYGVRFDPAGIQDMLAEAGCPAPARREAEILRVGRRAAAAAPPSKPPIGDEALKAWWAFYRLVRRVEQQTEEDALACFARCCTDHSLARARLRALRGPQKSGPKPGRAAIRA